MTLNELLYFSLFAAGGIIAGFFVKKVISPIVRRAVARTKWTADDLIIESVGKWLIPWFVAMGVFLGWRRVEMDEKYHHWLENGLLIFYIFSITWISARVLSGMTKIRSGEDGTVVASSSIVGNIIKVVVYCIGILVILQSLGISITPVLKALGVGGLAVALALQDTLSNLFAGIQIISTKKIRHGDFIQLESGQEGFVEDISWRYTTIRTGADVTVIVPNSKLASVILSNYFLPTEEFVFNIPLGVDYSSDLEKVETVTVGVLKEMQRDSEDCVKDFEPFIRFQQFGESSIGLKAFMRVKTYGSQFLVKHELMKRLQKKYKQEGINIPFPVRNVFLNKRVEE
ncbi:MAG TPA: mechanosensitive ion channel family protein [Agriterribacter sp.]|nr:mechanosensitive ion channel family protein [Agriterribacter sp.]